MREVIENVRKMLSDGLFSDEQHVRYSLVGRICHELGWNIWNPAEFYTEYPVKKYPPQEVTTELRGRVDVALFLADKRTDKAEVFIEVKSPGRLQYELQAGETQLQRYNYWDKAAICILTDGITWRFYLPSEGGSFDSTLFNEFHILNDSVEIICLTLDKVLRRDKFRKQAVQTASDMYEELGKIRLIYKVKNKAIQIASDTGMDMYMIAKQLLVQTEHVNLDIAEIMVLWDRTIPGGVIPPPPPPPPPPPGDILTDYRTDYAFMKAKSLIICQNANYRIISWRDVKKQVYNYLLSQYPSIVLEGVLHYSKNEHEFREAIELDNGYFTEGNLSATELVNQSRAAMQAAGFNPIKDLTIGYLPSIKKGQS